MNKIRGVVFAVSVLLLAGCASMGNRVYVFNGTAGTITDSKVTLGNGEVITFGVLDPLVDAGVWPVKGRMGRESTVEWTDARQVRKSAKAVVERKFLDDSIIFLINSNDTVTVETGRGLYGHKRR